MLNRIEISQPSIAENIFPDLQAPFQPQADAVQKFSALSPRPIRPEPLGVILMRERHGEEFTGHYYSAWNAAGRIDGKEFLEHFRALKSCAQQAGMSSAEFRDFERCLYRRFYRAASRDSMQRNQDGRELRVKPEELAFIAKVADISPGQLEGDAIAMRRSETSGEMKAIVARNGLHFRSRGYA